MVIKQLKNPLNSFKTRYAHFVPKIHGVLLVLKFDAFITKLEASSRYLLGKWREVLGSNVSNYI